MARPTIVIIGAGFVGLPAARQLRQRLPDARIVLVDLKDYFLFTPRLIDALSGDKNTAQQTASLPDIAKRDGFEFIQGRATNVDRERQIAFVTDSNQEIQPITYDRLILAQGASTDYYHIPGADRFTFPLKTFEDVGAIHARIEEILEKKQPLAFAVVGAGPSGVEAVFALRHYLRARLSADPETFAAVRITLLQATPQILPGFPLAIVNGTMEELKQNGIRVVLGNPVEQIGASFLMTSSGERVDTSLALWTAGIRPNGIESLPTLKADARGCLTIDRYLQADPIIFSAGDCTMYRENNVTIPKNAQTALLMSRLIADNVVRSISHQPIQPFRYRAKGNLLVLDGTGFVDAKLFTFKTRLAPWIRDAFYAHRFRQIVG
jgi:NADH dehydrogenase